MKLFKRSTNHLHTPPCTASVDTVYIHHNQGSKQQDATI